ncbi:predicted protein [Nematostella vectensis]|uniref:Copper transport protein n=1 Tax=Nematostella vectensis TaxID=45351 RepID=A7SPJ2_NEMVE|nr:probable low affinity copper uptake protein 2 [Nematostella vectensis]EDO34377.1 predicted protein [Nematostella vectensis]|eukprot:XP_001626477.1 predicted protein [Nematostella vectensis]
MHFSAGDKVTILFEGWKTNSVTSMALSVLVVFFLSILYEFLKAFRIYKPRNQNNPEATLLLARNRNEIGLERRPPKSLGQHLEDTFFFLLNFIFAYFLMLVAMTCNAWLFSSIILGCGLGYFFAQPLCKHYLTDNPEPRMRTYGLTDGPGPGPVI